MGAVQKLLDLETDVAHVVKDGAKQEALFENVRVADLVRVRPGQRVPVDGQVEPGESGGAIGEKRTRDVSSGQLRYN